MKTKFRFKRYLPLIIILAVLILDQGSKFLVKLNMQIGEEIRIFSWFRIHFLENNGMAFGLSFGENFGKLALSLVRLAAIVFLCWYISRVNRAGRISKVPASNTSDVPCASNTSDALCASNTSDVPCASNTSDAPARKTALLISLSLILAGAIGNMIDCAFYGLIFSESYFHVAELFPAGGGYAPLMFGRVVDMLYFPLIQGCFPAWMPWIGGHEFLFFRPVFNIADSAVTVGFVWFLLTQRTFWWPGKNPSKSA